MPRFTTLCLLGFFAAFTMAMNLADPLGDFKWAVKVIPDPQAISDGGKPFDDTLSFKNGTFKSEYLLKKGFKPASYDEDMRKYGPATFTVTVKSDSGETVKWTGTVAATSITGDIVWTKKDGTMMNFSYSGERAED